MQILRELEQNRSWQIQFDSICHITLKVQESEAHLAIV